MQISSMRGQKLPNKGYDLRFKRMWEYYLAYCQAGFEADSINVGLFKIINEG